ncbi:MAG TPA: hypothetical protein VGN72_15350 [Tepidisphaeraceae bacterium]|jgi:hypothetical protein|nr:hypothetical protein [Tepidisphaeraceae bacterium]
MRFAALSIACLLVVSLLPPAVFVRAAEEPGQSQITVRPGGDLTAQELATLLDAHVWKLNVSLPEGAKEVSIRLDQQANGKDRVGFGAGINTPLMADTKREVLIAIVPIGGGLSEAEKVRVTIIGFGMVASRTDDNPLRKLGIGGPVGSPEAAGDGTFNLIGGYEGGNISSPVSKADRVISLKIETR